MSMVINRRDLDFLLNEVLDTERLLNREKYAEHDLSTLNAVLNTAHDIAEDKFAPHADKSDAEEPYFDGERVHIIPEVADALETLTIDAKSLAAAIARARVTTTCLAEVGQRGENNLFLANATVYLEMMGRIVMSWIWLRQAIVAVQAIGDVEGEDKAFYDGKIQACHYFIRWELSKAQTEADLLESLDSTCLLMPEAAF